MVPSCIYLLIFCQEMRHILITGSFGFVGSQLVLHYLNRGWTVHLLDLPNHPLKAEMLRQFDQAGEYRLFESDICDIEAVTRAVNGCEQVIHAAALLNSTAPFERFYKTNVLGTQTVCEACLKANSPQLTLISTSDVFGIPGPNRILTETSPFRTWEEPYADTKIQAANYVKDLRAKGLLRASIVYPGWVYGEGDRQFFPAVMDMVRGKVVFTWQKGAASEIYFIHISDLIAGIDKIIQNPKASNRDYLLLDANSGVTPLNLYQIIGDYLGVGIKHVHLPYSVMMSLANLTQTLTRLRILPKPLLSRTDVKAFGNGFRFSTQRALKELGWQPEVATHEGIVKALHWQTEHFEQHKM